MEGKNYIFTESSVHELHTLAKRLYTTFAQADKKLVENQSCLTHSFEVDYSLRPWEFYDVRVGSAQCHIHKLRNGTFTLYCQGFEPQLSLYDDTLISNDFYAHLFGKYLTFDECKNAFADVVVNMLQFKVRPLF